MTSYFEHMDVDTLGSSVRQEFGTHLALGVETRVQMLISEVSKVVNASAYGTQPFSVTPSFAAKGDLLRVLDLLYR